MDLMGKSKTCSFVEWRYRVCSAVLVVGCQQLQSYYNKDIGEAAVQLPNSPTKSIVV